MIVLLLPETNTFSPGGISKPRGALDIPRMRLLYYRNKILEVEIWREQGFYFLKERDGGRKLSVGEATEHVKPN